MDTKILEDAPPEVNGGSDIVAYPQPPGGNAVLAAALDYASRGWCILPVKPGTKAPAVSWKRYQTQRPSIKRIRDWFKDDNLGVAVVLGAVSGGLACRDFDRAESYHEWAGNHPELAISLPTVATPRGFHVYIVATEEGFVKLDDGEFRADGKHYVVLPPSRHPSGDRYRWLVHLGDGPPPTIDPREAGLIPPGRPIGRPGAELKSDQAESRPATGAPDRAPPSSGTPLETDPPSVAALAVVRECLPTRYGERNAKLFDLARGLKGLDEFAGKDAESYRPAVTAWFNLARPKIRTKDWGTTWQEFTYALGRVRCPRGPAKGGSICRALQRAKAGWDGSDKFDLLRRLCSELQQDAGPGVEFYISSRAVAKMLGTPRRTVSYWLVLMEHPHGPLLKTTPGTRHAEAVRHPKNRKANGYVYLPQHAELSTPMVA
jgi:hypothetical protein